jgi:hypothetical protein
MKRLEPFTAFSPPTFTSESFPTVMFSTASGTVYRSQILSPWLGIWYSRFWQRVGYRPAGLHRLAGRYNNPMPESTISPSQFLRIGYTVPFKKVHYTLVKCYIYKNCLSSRDRKPERERSDFFQNSAYRGKFLPAVYMVWLDLSLTYPNRVWGMFSIPSVITTCLRGSKQSGWVR